MTIFTMKNRIMLGVYLIYSMRRLKSPFIAESFIFVILAIILSIFVSVPSVLSNMLDSGDSYHYFILAFSNTELLVQAVLVLSGLTTLFFMRNIPLRTVFKQRFV